jgi:CRISPR/Cas system CSM-associated protein Csm3 (group 7 of RAMP superfamily)
METLTFEGSLTALTPIFTGGDEKTGIEVTLRRIDYMVDGEKVAVPLIDGNSIRGVLRRLLLADFFGQVAYEIKSTRIFYLFSGGALEEVSTQDSGTLNLQLRREIRANIPPLSLFGGSFGNQAFAGKLIVAKALPICKELTDYLPVKSKLSFHDFLTETFATRHAEREPPQTVEQNPKKEEPTIQMKYNLETFTPGAKFYHKFMLLDASPIEKSCFARMLELWKERPFVGGKSATGFGEVKIDYPTMKLTSEAYLAFLQERKKEIVKSLDHMAKL